MPGITSLFNIGKKSLFANQAAIEVVGNNISNVNTPGYSRQAVRFEDGLYLNYSLGQLGTGVNAVEVIRYFDEFIEGQYNSKASERERWNALYENLQHIEMIFNEANASGISSALDAFWSAWQVVASRPDDTSARTALLEEASALERALKLADTDLRKMQDQMDRVIGNEVKEINQLLKDIAEINTKINITEETGKNNANGLRDQRASLVRELAEKLDITYIDNGLGNVTILTTAGHTLVDGGIAFRLAFEGAQVIADVKASAPGEYFEGELRFEGGAKNEYLVEIVDGGDLGVATFRVSTDDGRTWTNGYTAEGQDNPIVLDDGLVIYFDPDPNGHLLVAGDSFYIYPKDTLFWYETSTSKVNITPQILPNGQDNDRRLIGGSLAGYFQFRDDSIGGYLERLDAFSKSLAWEVNRMHSQGAGLSRFEETIGTYRANNTTASLHSAGLLFAKELVQGSVQLHLYDATTGQLARTLSVNINPASDTLEDVQAALDGLEGLSATILDGKLQLKADEGYDFAFGTDTTGLWAALGINTFFEGDSSGALAINMTVRSNTNYLNTGHVNGAGEMNEGDNTTATAIASLQYRSVAIFTLSDGTTTQSLGDYYSTLVARVGSQTQNAKFNSEHKTALAADLLARQDAVSGVNLDEEMTNLIKFQHAYTAAAKLITTAESMLQVLLGMKN